MMARSTSQTVLAASSRTMLPLLLALCYSLQLALAGPVLSPSAAETVTPSQRRRLNGDAPLAPPPPPPPSMPLETKVTFEIECQADNDDDDDDRRARALQVATTISRLGVKNYVDESLPPDVSHRDVVVRRRAPPSGRRLSELDACTDFVYDVEIFTSRSATTSSAILTSDVLDIVRDDDFEEDLNDKFIGILTVQNIQEELSVVPSPFAPPSSPPPPSPP